MEHAETRDFSGLVMRIAITAVIELQSRAQQHGGAGKAISVSFIEAAAVGLMLGVSTLVDDEEPNGSSCEEVREAVMRGVSRFDASALTGYPAAVKFIRKEVIAAMALRDLTKALFGDLEAQPAPCANGVH